MWIRKWWREIGGALAVLVARLASMPRTPWENDEFLFMEGVRRFDPFHHHPHPPGYPLYVLVGEQLNLFIRDPFVSLVWLGIASSVALFVAAALLFRKYSGDPDLSLAGALLLSFSASMIVHAPLAFSDVPALACAVLAFLAASHATSDGAPRFAAAFGLWSSAAIGFRPQLLVPLAPVIVIVLWQMRSVRERLSSLGTFSLVSALWFIPLVDALGGLDRFFEYEGGQAAYFASHDAAMSRGARGLGTVAVRFLLHPWGAKTLSFPIAFLVILGAVVLVRRGLLREKARLLLPLAVFTGIQIVFEIGWMDPADAARYSLPSTVFFAFLAGAGLSLLVPATHWKKAGVFGALGLAALGWHYVLPIVRQRTSEPSPPVAAAEFIRRTMPRNTVVLYDLSLRPHAEYLLPHFRTAAIEPGLREFYDRSSVPVVLFVDGGSTVPEAHVFDWEPSDAYGKLTRNFYRVVTVDPIRPEERFLPLHGVYALERTVEGEDWRWLARDAAIRLPSAHKAKLALTFALSKDMPYDADRVDVFVNGTAAGSATPTKKKPAGLVVDLPPGPVVDVRIAAAQDFQPATVLQNQDPRVLAVQLVGFEQR